MSQEIIQKQIEAYRSNFLKFGDSPKGTFQNNTETQYLRFARLLRNLIANESDKFSIHDVGSGLCDLHDFLMQQKINHFYSGTEIVQEMIDVANQKYPDISLYNRDLLKVVDMEVYDFVVLSGTFNLPGSVSNEAWKEHCLRIIRQMFSLAKKAISFNFLTTESTFRDAALFYLSPPEILTFCQKELSRFILVDSGYPLYEVTVTVFKKNYIKSMYKDDVFTKYFKN